MKSTFKKIFVVVIIFLAIPVVNAQMDGGYSCQISVSKDQFKTAQSKREQLPSDKNLAMKLSFDGFDLLVEHSKCSPPKKKGDPQCQVIPGLVLMLSHNGQSASTFIEYTNSKSYLKLEAPNVSALALCWNLR